MLEAVRRRWLLLPVVLLSLLPYGRIPYGLGFPAQHDLAMSDLLHAHLPYRSFLGERLSQWALPIWWPKVFSGASLLAQIEAGVFYVPQWPFYAWLDPYLAFCLATGSSLLIAAAGTHRLARTLGAGAYGAAFAAIAFTGCGFNLSHVKHPNFLYASAWLPWVLYALERTLDRERPSRYAAPMLAAFLALEALAGMPQVLFMVAYVVVARVLVDWVGRMRSHGFRDASRPLLPLAAAGALGSGIMAVQVLPTVAFLRESIRPMEITRATSTQYDSGFQGVLTFIRPDAAGQPFWGISAGCIQWEVYAFCGLSTLLLAAFALGFAERSRPRWFLFGLLVVPLLLSFGGRGPLFELAWDFLPGMKSFRFHQRWMLFVELALCVFAGIGLDRGLARISDRLRAPLGLVALVLVSVELTVAGDPFLPVDPIDAWRRPNPVEALIERDAGRVLMADGFSPWFDTHLRHRGFDAAGTAPFVRMARWPIGSMPSLLGHASPSGYVNLVERRVGALWMYDGHVLRDPRSLLSQWRDAPIPESYPLPRPPDFAARLSPRFAALLARSSVATLVTDRPIASGELGLRTVGQAGGLHVHRSARALPRAYLASRWIPVGDFVEALRALHNQPPFDPRIPILETRQRPRTSGSPEIVPVTLREPSPERLELDVRSDGAWLVVTDSMAPGWRATVDGSPTEIVLANGFQRAVYVPPGRHRVVFTYDCPGLREGALVSGVCLLALLAWFAFVRRRRGGPEQGVSGPGAPAVQPRGEQAP